MPDRIIPWSLSTRFPTGAYNSTIPLNALQSCFDLFGKHWQCQFPRVTRGARVNVIQSNKPLGRNVFATAGGSNINLDPLANFGRSPYVLAIVILHEFGHLAGGSRHSSDLGGLMSFNGGTSGGWLPSDAPWFKAYKLRGAFPPPGAIRADFASSVVDIDIRFGCGRTWLNWFPSSP